MKQVPAAQDLQPHGAKGSVMLRVEKVTELERLEALVPEWEALEERLSPRLPYMSPLWNILWWRHFREARVLLRDELYTLVVRDAEGNLVGVAPMSITHRPANGPVRTRGLHFLGADSYVTEMSGVVCRAEDQNEVISELVRFALANQREWDWLHWSGLRHGAKIIEAQAPRGTLVWSRPLPDYYLTLPESWQQFKSGLRRNIKESLRKCYNSLKRDGHTFVFQAVGDREGIHKALHTFFELHKFRSRIKGTVKHIDVFATPRARAFLSDYIDQMAARGQVRIFQLEINGKVVATRIGFVLGDELYFYFSGFDNAWGKYSVMTTVVAEAIKWAIDNRLKIANLSTGADVSKTRWSPSKILFKRGYLISPTLRGRIAYRSYRKARRLSRPGAPLSRLLTLVRRES